MHVLDAVPLLDKIGTEKTIITSVTAIEPGSIVTILAFPTPTQVIALATIDTFVTELALIYSQAVDGTDAVTDVRIVETVFVMH